MRRFAVIKPPSKWLCYVFLVLLVGTSVACTGGSGGGSQPDPADADVQISANNNRFSTARLVVPAGEPFTLAFTNQENAAHNVAIFEGPGGGEHVFTGEVFNGPDRTVIYEVPALEPGEYYFHCDVHPEMSGTVIAE